MKKRILTNNRRRARIRIRIWIIVVIRIMIDRAVSTLARTTGLRRRGIGASCILARPSLHSKLVDVRWFDFGCSVGPSGVV